MDDTQIIELFWKRSEDALTETKNSYAAYLRAIFMNILQNKEDCEECVNDTYFSAWNQIPPRRIDQIHCPHILAGLHVVLRLIYTVEIKHEKGITE